MNEQKIYDEYMEFYNLYDAVNMPLTPFGNFSKGYETAWQHQQKKLDIAIEALEEVKNIYIHLEPKSVATEALNKIRSEV